MMEQTLSMPVFLSVQPFSIGPWAASCLPLSARTEPGLLWYEQDGKEQPSKKEENRMLISRLIFTFIAGGAMSLLVFYWFARADLPRHDSPPAEHHEERLPSPLPSAAEDWSSLEPPSVSDLTQNAWPSGASLEGQDVGDPPLPPPPASPPARSLDSITPEESQQILDQLKEVQRIMGRS